jgi:Tfp pilus assembly protein PilF
MRQIFTIFFLLSASSAFGQPMDAKEWDQQAKTNIRLLPKYGLVIKTEGQKQADQNFITEVMNQEKFKGNRTEASNEHISLGFNYLYRGDLKTAMYRFNQAYLLDSLNSNIYWGYGAVYMTLGKFDEAKKLYKDGLLRNPNNPHLLTDYGTYFLSQYYELQAIDEKNASSSLDSATNYLTKSYEVESTDQNTNFKLSVCYLLKQDCDNAWKYYNECMALGGQPITEEFTKELKRRCKKKS